MAPPRVFYSTGFQPLLNTALLFATFRAAHAQKLRVQPAVKFDKTQGDWLAGILPELAPASRKVWTFQELQARYEAAGLDDFEGFWYGKGVTQMREASLLTWQ